MSNDVMSDLLTVQQLLQQGQVEPARAILKKLHEAYPQNPDILLNYAIAARLAKDWPEAIALLKKGMALVPGNPVFVEHLAMVLMLTNRGPETLESIGYYTQLLQQNPQHYAVAMNLLLLALRMDQPQAILAAIPPLLSLPGLNAEAQLHYAGACAIASYLVGDSEACARYVPLALAAAVPPGHDPYFLRIYNEFLRDLLAYRTQHPALYAAAEDAETLHVIGESHCLTAAHLVVPHSGKSARVRSHLIMGAKAYAFTLPGESVWKYTLEQAIRQAPAAATLIVGFGELDCRAREGIMEQYRRHPGYDVAAEIAALCATYVAFVKTAQSARAGRCYIVGVPAPNRVVAADLQAGEEPLFLEVFRQFNAALAGEAARHELGFIDLYAATAGADGWAKPDVHLDQVHLTPALVAARFTASV